MPTPSVSKQAPVTPVHGLMDSPRNYNASIIEFNGRRFMAYRSHRMNLGGRCGIAIAELDAECQAKSNHWVPLPDHGNNHEEDPRLFLFEGKLHLSFTSSVFHGKMPYTCVMRYARLSLIGGKTRWKVEQVFTPRYGRNDGAHQEKNWQFFEATPGKLAVIYDPNTILELDGETVTKVHEIKQTVNWPWGDIRGGTPPVQHEGKWLTIFHSSTPHPVPPHWRRYYAGAYVFDAATFKITHISSKPILVGSEEDGHGHDPRNVDSWKPFVVFPCGVIPYAGGYHVSYGINDHMSVVVDHKDLYLVNAALPVKMRFFYTENATKPVRYHLREDQPPTFLPWNPARCEVPMSSPGIMEADPRLALHLEEAGHEEISAKRYQSLRSHE